MPEFERMLVRSGIVLIKYWFSITDDEQHFRFMMRMHDPLKQWKLSPDGSGVAATLGGLHQGQGGDARAHAHSGSALVDRRGRSTRSGRGSTASSTCSLQIPYQEVVHDPIVLPARVHNPDYLRSPVPKKMYVPPVY